MDYLKQFLEKYDGPMGDHRQNRRNPPSSAPAASAGSGETASARPATKPTEPSRSQPDAGEPDADRLLVRLIERDLQLPHGTLVLHAPWRMCAGCAFCGRRSG
jgi:hypothetical protein